jgi:hypothetical protein
MTDKEINRLMIGITAVLMLLIWSLAVYRLYKIHHP